MRRAAGETLAEGPMRITEVLRAMPREKCVPHPVEDYMAAFSRTGICVLEPMSIGVETLTFLRNERSVLKVSHLDFGSCDRPFDAPVPVRGTIHLNGEGRFVQSVHFIIQPLVRMDASDEDSREFAAHVDRLGYCFVDDGAHQIGRHNGKIVLVDPLAVIMKGAYWEPPVPSPWR